MFTQKSPFGSGFTTTPAPFTSTSYPTTTTTTTTPGFGSTMNPTPFGSAPFSFAGTAPTSAPFSFSSPQTQQQPQQPQPFGATAPFPSFGGVSSAPSPFGQSTATKPMFGQPAPGTTTTTPFGSTSSNLFGQPGSTTTTTGAGIFGSTTTAQTNPFGQSSTTPSTFGQTQTQSSTSSSMFPFSSSPADNSKGTGNPKYAPTSETDPSGPTFHQSITAMTAYQKKSFEELKYEDYSLGRKGGTSSIPFGTSTSAPPFGQTQPQPQNPNLFGTFSSGTAFGTQPTTSTTGTTPAPFGFPAPTTAGAFGTSSVAPVATGFGAFPSTAAPASSFGFSSATQPAPTYSSATPSTQPAPAFGTSVPFGSMSTAQPSAPFTSSFGQPATTNPGSLFGGSATSNPAITSNPNPFSTPSTAFATPSQAPASSSFGFPTPSFGITPTSSTFGTGSTSTGLFSSAAAPVTSVFPTLGTTAFPSTPTAAQPLGSTSFFSPAAPATGGFGSGLGLGSVPTFTSPPTPSMSSNPYGTTPLPLFAPPSTQQPTSTPTSSVPHYTITSTPEDKKRVVSNVYRVTPRSSTRIKPRGYSTMFHTPPNEPQADSKQLLSPDSFIPRINIKSLVIEDEGKRRPYARPASIPNGVNGDVHENGALNNHVVGSALPTAADTNRDTLRSSSPISSTINQASTSRPSPTILQRGENSVDPSLARGSTPPSSKAQSLVPRLTKQGYYTTPKLADLENMSSDELSHVCNFTVHSNHGLVVWPGETDIRGLNLDEIVEFDRRSITVYQDDEKKPPLGEGLNRPAMITLLSIWPTDKSTQKVRRDAESLERYRKRLEKSTKNMNAKFMSYNPDKGEWVFSVDHFSRYGLSDEDDGDGDDHQDDAHDRNEQDDVQPNALSTEDSEQNVEVIDVQPAPSPAKVTRDRLPTVITRLNRLGVDSNRMKGFLAERDESGKAATQKARPQPPPLRHYETSVTTPPFSLSFTPIVVPDTISQMYDAPISLPKGGLQEWNVQCIASGKSVLRDSQLVSANISLVRSFRVGFGPDGSIARPASSSKLGRILFSSPPVPHRTIAHSPKPSLYIAPSTANSASPFYVPLLDAHLRDSRGIMGIDYSPCPSFVLSNACHNTKANIEIFTSQKSAHAYLVWTLVDALWGVENEEDKKSFLDRKLALVRWLQKAVAPAVEQTVSESQSVSRKVFAHLTGRQIPEAAALASRNKNLRLASLISQPLGYQDNHELLSEQLSVWDEQRATRYIDNELLSIYKLLAGDVESVTNTYKETLDWKRSFALHLWYKHPVGSPISSALGSYDRAVSKNSAVPPLPPYPSYEGTPFRDMAYQLLHLYASVSENSQPRVITEQLLNIVHPRNSTAHPMDYQLTWHLYTVLRNLSSLRPVPDLVHAHNVHISYASQLEMEGLWVWALYVLLHMPSRSGDWSIAEIRCKAVSDMLARHATELGPHQSFLEDMLHIPPDWIHQAKAWLAISQGQHDTASVCLQEAKLWDSAHNEIVNHLAAGWVFAAQNDKLLTALESLGSNSDMISDWAFSGGLYLAYLHLKHDVTEYKSNPDNTNLKELYMHAWRFGEQIDRKVSTHGFRIDPSNKGSNNKVLEGVCLAEMSTNVGAWLQALPVSRDNLRLITMINSLPIPTDYRSSILEDLMNDPLVDVR